MNDGSILYYGTANTALIEDLAANFEEYLGKFVYTSVSNVSKEFAETDDNCEKIFEIKHSSRPFKWKRPVRIHETSDLHKYTSSAYDIRPSGET